MILYAVQWHSAPLPPHVDENDLEWTTWRGHDDYVVEEEAQEAAREFDAAFDGAYVHRVVARRVEGPSVARARRSEVVAKGQTASNDAEASAAPARGRANGGGR
jgi:hypothetical protein